MHLYNIYSNFIKLWIFGYENGNKSEISVYCVTVCLDMCVLSIASDFMLCLFCVNLSFFNFYRNWTNSSTSRKLQNTTLKTSKNTTVPRAFCKFIEKQNRLWDSFATIVIKQRV